MFFLITLCIVIAGLLTVSCNSAVKEEFGTVVLDFGGGGTREVGADGLPLLNNSRILIKGEGSLSGPVSKEFSSAQGVSLSFPVGDEVKLRVSVLTPSARWSSAPVSFTVDSGTNAVGIKLSKKIAGLNNLLFTQTKGGTAVPLYDLSLSMDGKSITAPQSAMAAHIVARDSKGRVYVGYKANEPGEPQKLIRYTSEGLYDIEYGYVPPVECFANDYTTGKIYAAHGNSLYEIGENLHFIQVALPPVVALSAPFAADNDRFAWFNRTGKNVYISKKAPSVPNSTLIDGILDEYHLSENSVKELFFRGDYLYLLMADVSDPASADLYSLGAVLKMKLRTDNGNPVFTGDYTVIGKEDDPDFENGVLENYDYSENFYGAVKVIGFDEENLYIADEGFDAAYTDYSPVSLKTATA